MTSLPASTWYALLAAALLAGCAGPAGQPPIPPQAAPIPDRTVAFEVALDAHYVQACALDRHAEALTEVSESWTDLDVPDGATRLILRFDWTPVSDHARRLAFSLVDSSGESAAAEMVAGPGSEWVIGPDVLDRLPDPPSLRASVPPCPDGPVSASRVDVTQSVAVAASWSFS